MVDKKLDLSAYLKDFMANNTITTSNGLFVMDFSKIEDLNRCILRGNAVYDAVLYHFYSLSVGV